MLNFSSHETSSQTATSVPSLCSARFSDDTADGRIYIYIYIYIHTLSEIVVAVVCVITVVCTARMIRSPSGSQPCLRVAPRRLPWPWSPSPRAQATSSSRSPLCCAGWRFGILQGRLRAKTRFRRRRKRLRAPTPRMGAGAALLHRRRSRRPPLGGEYPPG